MKPFDHHTEGLMRSMILTKSFPFPIEQYIQPPQDAIRVLKGHQLPITCVCVSPDDKFVFSGSKDCSIIKCKIYKLILLLSLLKSVWPC